MKPLFMWAGGKSKLIKKYRAAEVLPEPESFNKYIEPFVGAGAMFIWAYQKNPTASFVINDLNSGIMNIYKAIKGDVSNFTEELDRLSEEYLVLPKGETNKALEKSLEKDWVKLFQKNPCRRYFYYRLRDQHAFEYEAWTKTKEAAVLYFLMKTGFNGVWQENKNTNNRFGTPSGLLNQKTEVYDIENVLKWSRALKTTHIMTGDFQETLSEVGEGSFVFLDPPYRGSFTQYETDFDDQIQQKVINYLNSSADKGAYVMMSNRDVGDGFFESRVGNNEMLYFDVTYTVGRRKKNEDGSFSAKKAKEILMIGKKSL